LTTLEGRMDIATVFEWFAEESKSIAEQAAETAQREKFAKLASLWANAMAESTSATVGSPNPPNRTSGHR
jgi:5'-deoxynucleotidase YfbR-like HD superfamily hydrolase